MTQEEKAKAYDKAAKVIKGNLDALNEITETGVEVVNIQSIKNCFYRAFPELKESDDEKVEKAIFGMVYDSDNELWGSYDVSKSDVLAWLEKQNKRSPLSKDEEYTLARIIEYLEDNDCPSEWKYLLHDVYAFPHQKEQNPAWSEEDEERVKETLAIIETIEDINKAKDGFLGAKLWLKSLKERYTWKPSDEQLRELQTVSTGRGWFKKEILRGLLEQLKKLKG